MDTICFAGCMPNHAFRLLATLLSLDPAGRGTTAAALDAEYFTTATTYACDPASLPKYAPNIEMDAKLREDSRRSNARTHAGEAAGKRAHEHAAAGHEPEPRAHRGIAACCGRRWWCGGEGLWQGMTVRRPRARADLQNHDQHICASWPVVMV
ncbi:hypothetical protein PVAP13_3KG274100 [Panicum virgatum]|uniref:Uncharacterized protein n=2 Tax=Panicum virgatum TaxID=38727 RepID=A0A8T0V9G7_PANVG|nr:hypothetical protein PVAP13_3KG274100 [Panicum virgatum]